ncbi:MAG: beta-ketoacyl-ACP synthase III [Eubacteriales bacterium]|nr:beta-ketoacyl-ACP synthase III [Eubacteriales bacterium]
MKGIQIVSTGKALPEEIITNDDLSRIVDTSDEWITTRTGIKKRYRCRQENTTSLAVNAARNAVKQADINTDDIGAVIVATSTAENAFPSTAAIVQKELGLSENVLAFDLSSACTGFLHALNVGHALLNSTDYKYILLIGSEQMSKIIDYTDRSTCVLFGDGAGAVLIKADDNMYEQINYTRGNEDVLVCKGLGAQDAYVQMNGNAVFRFAVDVLKQGIDEILKKSDMTIADIDYIVCHQANERIINHVKKKYPGHEDKFYVNIAEYGNTSAASIPIALDELAEKGCLNKGRKLILAGFGAGLSWSCALIET